MFSTFKHVCHACLHVWSSHLAYHLKALVTRKFVEASEIMVIFVTFVNSCGGINNLFPLFLTWLFVPQSSTSSAILNQKGNRGLNIPDKKEVCKVLWVCSSQNISWFGKKAEGTVSRKLFWVSRCITAFCASLDCRELFCTEFRTFQDESAVCPVHQDRLSHGKTQLPWQGVVSHVGSTPRLVLVAF